jgi:hypothetical protein
MKGISTFMRMSVKAYQGGRENICVVGWSIDKASGWMLWVHLAEVFLCPIWIEKIESTFTVNCLAAADTALFAGTASDGVFVSWDGGATWRPKTFGDPAGAHALLIVGHDLFAAFSSHVGSETSVWYQRLSDLLTAVHQPEGTLPASFALEQNYPNPFNPSTTISFSIPSRSFVSLKIFDVMGREVATIVSDHLSAGRYERQWNASGSASGMYFYRLQAGSFTETKRLAFVKWVSRIPSAATLRK